MLITKPIQPFLKFLFKSLILPLYNFLHLTKKQTRTSLINKGGDKLNLILTSKTFFYFTIIFIFLTVIINNLIIKTVTAEDLGKKSLFYKLVQGNEFEEIIEESTPKEQNTANELALNQNYELYNSNLNIQQLPDQELIINPEENTPPENPLATNLQKGSVNKTTSSPESREKITDYIVQSGDTFSAIAKKFNISINTILWANNLSANSLIKPGNKLVILPVTGVLHKVTKGETISSLAKKYSIDATKILAINQIISDEQISIGQNLIIPDAQIKSTPSTPANNTSLAANLRQRSNETNIGGYIWPTAARHITQYFGWRHSGLDIGGPTGTPIYAAKKGKVITSGWTSVGYGNYIIIQHPDGTKTLYGHMSKLYFRAGDEVNQGDTIGAMGSTGRSTGPHLHFEVIISGKRVNPLSYL